MTLENLKSEIQKYQYMEDTGVIDISLASLIATRLKLGDPIWMIIIGASSGGKSQILRPLALTDAKFMHRVDDLTENTFLSGMAGAKGEGSTSLLDRIGNHGMMVVSDFTVIFSKNSEARTTILSQFRMIYDGEMVKMSGNMKEPKAWRGYLGVLAGSTPSIYHHFEEVADMGERFIYYRMKEYDALKATKLALGRKMFGKELDAIISGLYAEYLKDIVANGNTNVVLSEVVEDRIIEVSSLAEKIRTTVHMDFRQEKIVRVPTPAMPMRVALQLKTIAMGLTIMRGRELNEQDLGMIDWCAYSLANEEKRSCLNTLCAIPFGVYATTSTIADKIGLNTYVVNNILQNLSAVGVLKRSGDSNSLTWKIADERYWKVIRRINGIVIEEVLENRKAVAGESGDLKEIADKLFDELSTAQ